MRFNVNFTDQDEFDIDLTEDEQFDTETDEVIFVGGGASTWSQLQGKPFNTIGENLKVVNGSLQVDTAPNVEQDNTKPITSAAVYTEVGNINALLQII